MTDRGVFYEQRYDIGGGKAWSQSTTDVAGRSLGWYGHTEADLEAIYAEILAGAWPLNGPGSGPRSLFRILVLC